jgi:glycosyltransferase involved in cell wall biosynthesis
MGEIRLSVVVPTLGRDTLERTLASIDAQLDRRDEVVVVADGPSAAVVAREVLYRFADDGDPAFRMYETPLTRCWGNAQRDVGVRLARGTHLLFVDDDDEYLPGAFDIVRQALAAEAQVAHIFRMRFGPGHPAYWRDPDHPLVLWAEPVLRAQNLGTPMVVLPKGDRLPLWVDGDAGDVISDFLFLRRAIPRFGAPVWHEDVIAVVRPA